MIKKLDKKIKWHIVTQRGKNHALLFIDGVGLGIKKNYAKAIYGINYRIKDYRQFNGARWIGEDDYNALVKIMEKKIKQRPDIFYSFGCTMEKIANRIIKKVNKLKKIDWKKLTNKDLIKIISEMTDLQAKLWSGGAIYSYYFFFNDIVLENFVKNLRAKFRDNFDKMIGFILAPKKMTLIGIERLDLLKMAKKFIKNGEIYDNDIKQHLQKYAFINKYYFWGEGWSYKDIENRSKELMARNLFHIKDEIEKTRIKKIDLDKYNFTRYEMAIIKSMKEASYALALGDEATNCYCYYLRGLFDEIAKRLKITYNELVSMRFCEIVDSLLNKKLIIFRKALKERFKNHALIFKNGESVVLSGKELEKYKQKNTQKLSIDLIDLKEIGGNIANSGGIIEGRVRLIMKKEDVVKFKDKEILVTPMTNPSFVPAMQKAAVIVTDEGGILSHAAIVSRELGIPCIVGTKIATQVLKDGDLVEVDANKGVVKIIKK